MIKKGYFQLVLLLLTSVLSDGTSGGTVEVVNNGQQDTCQGNDCGVGSLESPPAAKEVKTLHTTPTPSATNKTTGEDVNPTTSTNRIVPKGRRRVQQRWEPPDFDNSEDEAEYYGPLDRFWRHSAVTETLIMDGEDYYPKISSCLDERLTPREWIQIRRPQQLDRRIGQRFIDRDGTGPVFLVEIQNAMSPIHAKAVRALNACVRIHIPQLHEKRPMYQVYEVDENADESIKDEMGGNNPTHLNSIIGIFLPDLVREQYATLRMAYHFAGWRALVVKDELMGEFRSDAAFAEVGSAGMRACEFLSYEGFSRLMEHQDGYPTSVVLNVMLSDPNDYKGGEFYIQDKEYGEYHVVRPGQYSALAFLGGTFSHGVSPINGGSREALSTEFWYYPDLPFGVNLCAAEFNNVEEYIRKCNRVQWDDDEEDFDYEIPCDLEFPSHSIYGVCHSCKGTIKEKNVYNQREQGQQQQQQQQQNNDNKASPHDHEEL